MEIPGALILYLGTLSTIHRQDFVITSTVSQVSINPMILAMDILLSATMAHIASQVENEARARIMVE